MLVVGGFAVHKGWLSPAEQAAMAGDIAGVVAAAPFFAPLTPWGKPMSVRMTAAGRYGWFTDRKGYRYVDRHPDGTEWPPIPERVLAVWRALVSEERMPDCCLVNWYGEKARMGLHRDADEKDFSWPVLSISLGDSGLFRMGDGARRPDDLGRPRLRRRRRLRRRGAARLSRHRPRAGGELDAAAAGRADQPDAAGGRLTVDRGAAVDNHAGHGDARSPHEASAEARDPAPPTGSETPVPVPDAITVDRLAKLIGTPRAPTLLDVRSESARAAAPRLLPGARTVNTLTGSAFDRLDADAGRPGGHRLRRGPCAEPGRRRARCARNGLAAEYLEGGQAAWSAAGLPTIDPGKITARDGLGRSVWVTRSRPKIDRIACPWLIRRFVDPRAVFLYVAPAEVPRVAELLRRDALSTSRTSSGAIAANAAPSTRSSRSSASRSRRSTGWRRSCAAPTRRGPTSRRKRRGCSPPRSGSRGCTPTTSRSSRPAWGSTTPSIAGRATPRRRPTTGPRRGPTADERTEAGVSDPRRGDAGLDADRASVLRRAGRADRGDAPHPRRGEALARRRALPACAQLLHAAARAGGAAARDLHRLAAARHARRARRRACSSSCPASSRSWR